MLFRSDGNTAADLISAAISAGQSGTATVSEVTVKLGGLYWIPTYLSTTKDGKPILTLWLSGIDSLNYPSNYGQPVLDSHENYSPFNEGWGATSNTWTTPANMYGSSYVRAVTLNNGGKYASAYKVSDGAGDYKTDPTRLGLITQVSASSISLIDWSNKAKNATTNKYYEFTQGSISNLLVAPERIAWQETQGNSITKIENIGGTFYNYNNESWSRTMG